MKVREDAIRDIVRYYTRGWGADARNVKFQDLPQDDQTHLTDKKRRQDGGHRREPRQFLGTQNTFGIAEKINQVVRSPALAWTEVAASC